MSGSPLADSLRRLIADSGPISLMHFMGESNARYYSAKDPLGSGGDFITAPEISQMFGEMIGLWLTDLWLRAGRPAVHYVELGPGRGTLAQDALRAMRGQGLEPQVHLVEGSEALRQVQAEAVPGARFHHDLGSVPQEAPMLLVANEFLDALPVRQLVMTAAGWREVLVGTDDDGNFVPVAGGNPMDGAVPVERRSAAPGSIIETSPAASATIAEASERLARHGGAAVFIDYGHTQPRTGSTLQAVRSHQKVDPFAAPGEADLTAHVDFATLAEVARSKGAKLTGMADQGQWLRSLGVEQRAEALARQAPGQRETLRRALERLTAADQMGEVFKVMALSHPDWPHGAGF